MNVSCASSRWISATPARPTTASVRAIASLLDIGGLLSVDAFQLATGALESAGSGLRGYSDSGRRIRNVVPRPGSELASTLPPCASTTAATIARPRPTPPLERERLGSAAE